MLNFCCLIPLIVCEFSALNLNLVDRWVIIYSICTVTIGSTIREVVVTVAIGNYIRRVITIDESIYSREYGVNVVD